MKTTNIDIAKALFEQLGRVENSLNLLKSHTNSNIVLQEMLDTGGASKIYSLELTKNDQIHLKKEITNSLHAQRLTLLTEIEKL